jgi:hypothetical protein
VSALITQDGRDKLGEKNIPHTGSVAKLVSEQRKYGETRARAWNKVMKGRTIGKRDHVGGSIQVIHVHTNLVGKYERRCGGWYGWW